MLHVVDTTGAGDCFTAAFAVAMLEGKSDKDAMEFASVAASLCIQQQGAIPSLPSRQEVDKESVREGDGVEIGRKEENEKKADIGPRQTFW